MELYQLTNTELLDKAKEYKELPSGYLLDLCLELEFRMANVQDPYTGFGDLFSAKWNVTQELRERLYNNEK